MHIRSCIRHIKGRLKFWFITYPKYNKDEKTNYHLYRKNLRKTRKILIKASKQFCPWDYGYLLDLIAPVIREWVEYYKRGYNVWAAETENQPSRLEVAQHLEELLNDYYDDDSVTYINDGELLRELFKYLYLYITLMWD